MVRALGRSPSSSLLLLFCSGALGLPRGEYLDFPRPMLWEEIAVHYRMLFAAHASQPQDVLLRLVKTRFGIKPRVREPLASLGAEGEERLTI